MKRLLFGALLLFLAVPAYAGGNYIFHKSFVVEPEYVATDEMTYIATDSVKLEVPVTPTDPPATPTGDEELPATPTDDEQPPTTPTSDGEDEAPVDDFPSIDSEGQTIPLDDEADQPEDENPSQAEQSEGENPSQAEQLDGVADDEVANIAEETEEKDETNETQTNLE